MVYFGNFIYIKTTIYGKNVSWYFLCSIICLKIHKTLNMLKSIAYWLVLNLYLSRISLVSIIFLFIDIYIFIWIILIIVIWIKKSAGIGQFWEKYNAKIINIHHHHEHSCFMIYVYIHIYIECQNIIIWLIMERKIMRLYYARRHF